ncbi:hypothetical protein ACJW30_03G165400 [Castanea mollissima]
MEVLRKIVMLLPMANKMPRWAYGISFSFLRCLDKDFFLEDDKSQISFRVCLHNMAKLAKEATTVQRVLESLFCYFDNGILWSLEHGVALFVLLDTQSTIEKFG